VHKRTPHQGARGQPTLPSAGRSSNYSIRAPLVLSSGTSSTQRSILATPDSHWPYGTSHRAGLVAGTSDAHELSILAEYCLASKPPRSTRALLDYPRLLPPLIFRCATVFDATRRRSTPLAATREGAALPDDPRLASCSTRPLVCITDPGLGGRRRPPKRKPGTVALAEKVPSFFEATGRRRRRASRRARPTSAHCDREGLDMSWLQYGTFKTSHGLH
jgi:hypothetical protein